jgi:hypothetical protein
VKAGQSRRRVKSLIFVAAVGSSTCKHPCPEGKGGGNRVYEQWDAYHKQYISSLVLVCMCFGILQLHLFGFEIVVFTHFPL